MELQEHQAEESTSEEKDVDMTGQKICNRRLELHEQEAEEGNMGNRLAHMRGLRVFFASLHLSCGRRLQEPGLLRNPAGLDWST